MSEEIDKAEDIRSLQKTVRLQARQIVALQQHLNDSNTLVNVFMQTTNRTLKLHEQAIGILSARQKEMREGK